MDCKALTVAQQIKIGEEDLAFQKEQLAEFENFHSQAKNLEVKDSLERDLLFVKMNISNIERGLKQLKEATAD